MICETIKKGNNVGSRTSNQSNRPLLEASSVCVGNVSKNINNVPKIMYDKIFFKFLPESEICTSYVGG